MMSECHFCEIVTKIVQHSSSFIKGFTINFCFSFQLACAEFGLVKLHLKCEKKEK